MASTASTVARASGSATPESGSCRRRLGYPASTRGGGPDPHRCKSRRG
ncbi:hypothetical protein I552_3310 [Mycobacterium xenopi 3993]|nr:hypothetical protein I552_3310 [Mycobacterium xenopi 3993]